MESPVSKSRPAAPDPMSKNNRPRSPEDLWKNNQRYAIHQPPRLAAEIDEGDGAGGLAEEAGAEALEFFDGVGGEEAKLGRRSKRI